MKNIHCVLICMLGLATGCAGSFSAREVKLLKSGEGKMHLWTVDVQEEAAFLRKKAKPLISVDLIAGGYQKLKSRMLATVTDTTNPGVGIAAPQVGIGSRVIAVQRFDKAGEPFEFYINPEIIHYSETRVCGMEGCLSIPEVSDSVWRADEIVISYISEPEVEKSVVTRDSLKKTTINVTRNAERLRDTVRGFTAVIFQHEIDHLDGILFTDRIGKKK